MAAIGDELAIGQMNKRIRIEKRTLTTDDHGGKAVSWSLRGVCWAAMEAASARDALQAGQITETLLTAFTTWYRTDLSVTDRIRLGSRTFQVVSIQDPSGQQTVLVLLAQEVQS